MRTAVATFGFGRPDHFERMLNSLGACPEVHQQTVDVFHFLDGGPGGQQGELRTLIEASGIPFVEIVTRSENYGVGRQLISARRELLDDRGYDRMVLVEDDIELNPTYLTTLLRLSDWAEQYADTGTVQVWNVEAGDESTLRPHLGEVELTNRHFVTYCLSKRVWDAIKPVLYEYERRYLVGCSYAKRPHYRIRGFMRRLLKRPRSTPQTPSLSPPAEAVHNPFPRVRWRSAPTSQDAITSLALYLAGLHRLTTRVPHAYYFGVTGVHCTPELYEFMGFNGQGWWRWSLDDVPTTFTVRYKDESGEWLRSSYR
jgi:GNAT superfamily N-acetyltransferase